MREDTADPHIILNPRGVPCLDATRHWALDLVADHVAHGNRVVRIVEAYPDWMPAQRELLWGEREALEATVS